MPWWVCKGAGGRPQPGTRDGSLGGGGMGGVQCRAVRDLISGLLSAPWLGRRCPGSLCGAWQSLRSRSFESATAAVRAMRTALLVVVYMLA